MLKSYIKIGLRSLLKYKVNTAIHVLGLAIGLAAFLLINQYVSFERSYDRFHKNSDRLYRLTTDFYDNDELDLDNRDAMSFAPAGKALEDALPEVVASTTTLQMDPVNFRRNGKPFQEDILAADSMFLNLFNYEVLEGDPTRLLSEPYSIVLTESHAKKYFNSGNAVGQTIEFLSYGGENKPFKVTGVIANPPDNTHYKFNILISISTMQERLDREGWNANNYYTYVLLDEQADIATLNTKIPALSKQLIDEDGENRFNLQPITDIHLLSDMVFEPDVHGSARAVNFLFIISIFILIIAWINYINLSTARAVERAKEVGMRKVVGAHKMQLIGQFFTESMLVNFLGMLLAVLLTHLALPSFNQLVGKTILVNIFSSPSFLKNLLLFFVIGTVVTGIYPAIVLSSFKPISTLKGTFSKTKHGVWLRKNLVVFQFAASFALIAGTMVVYQQLRFMTNKELGMQTDQVLSFNNPEYDGDDEKQFRSKYKSFQQALKQLNSVEKVGAISNLPGGKNSDINSTSGEFKLAGVTQDPVRTTLYINFMDDQIVDALGLNLVAGRNFNFEMNSDSNCIIINMAMLKIMNIPDAETALGKRLTNKGNFNFKIVGVIGDFNRSTLKTQVEPTFFIPRKAAPYSIAKLDSKDPKATIAQIEKTFLEFFPTTSFNPIFLDQKFEKLYAEDKRFGSVFTVFSFLTIFVAIMGLFGLAAFMSLQRTKEIGIRKVLGASIPEIIFLFFKDFVWLVFIGLVIGAPIIYFGMTEWLNGYAFRIEFPWWSMFVAMSVLVLISFLTVSLHSYKVARMNPVESIKTE